MFVEDYAVIGELQCLNCGRTLGEVVRAPGELKLRIRHAARQKEAQVRMGAHGSLQCTRCGGRAFLEPEIAPETQIARTGHNSEAPLVGAA
jgi:hypothetical protein